MKRVFPLIVVLITLSVVGILFIQMSWINNAMKLKREEFQRAVDVSLKQSTIAIQDQFMSKQQEQPIGEKSRKWFLEKYFTTQGWFTKDELHGIIESVLRQNNIKQPFEFCVENIFGYPVLNSDGFHSQDISTAYSIGLASDNSSMEQESLFISIHEDKNLIIREMAWMIIASVVLTTIIN